MPCQNAARALSVAAFAALVAVPSAARAQDNSAAVEQLFADGKRLMASGNIAEACPKFLASYNLENRVGTLMNLADCYEQNKQYASAWARFVEARTLATRNNQAERADYATKHAAALEARRSMLTLVADGTVAGLVIKRDGVVVAPAVYSVPVPVDGGPHTVEATAPGKNPLTDTVTLADEAETKTYTFAPLTEAVSSPSATDAAPSRSLSTRAIAGIATAGAGVVVAGVGAYFGVTALSKKSDSSPFCGADGHKDDCFGQGVQLRNDAVTDATISSVLFGVGAAAVAGGVVLWITAPSLRTAATVGFDGHLLHIGGTF